jgi:predicted signal transduction protein with EAL and GGDEF domain
MVGDMLLTKIGQRLTEGMRQGDTVARLGGDEFAVLLAELPTANTAVEIAERIQHVVGEPFKLGLHDVFTTTSIGIAISTSGYTSADDMVRDADIAMYRAKLLGKARAVVFDQEMHAHVMRRLQTENELRRALEREEFDVFYQPLVSLQNGRICGFEALLRWNHPERGLVPPGEFLHIAEETGLMVQIGRWLLRRACAHIVAWQERYPQCAPLGISVNLSDAQVLDPQLITDVAQVLRETGLPPAQLVLEITEGVILDHDDGVVPATLRSLRDLQVQLHLDDFGTGYASLISLHNLPISAVKIDRTFVSTMDAAPENNAIVRAIVALSQNLGLDVIAEGVETAVHLAALRAIGCPYAQGYYFSKPQHAVHAEAMLVASQHWQRNDHYVPKGTLPTIPHQKVFPSSAA